MKSSVGLNILKMMEDDTFSVISDSTEGSSPLLFSALRRAAIGSLNNSSYLNEGNKSPVIPSQNLENAFVYQGTRTNGLSATTLPEDPLLPKFLELGEPDKILFESQTDLFESQTTCEMIDTQFCQLNLGTESSLFKDTQINVDIPHPYENSQNHSHFMHNRTVHLSSAICEEKTTKPSQCTKGDEDSRSISLCSTLPPAAGSSISCIWRSGDIQMQPSCSLAVLADVNIIIAQRKSVPLSSHILHISESCSSQSVNADEGKRESFTKDVSEVTQLSNTNREKFNTFSLQSDVHATFLASEQKSRPLIVTTGTEKLKNITAFNHGRESCEKNILSSTITSPTKSPVVEELTENNRYNSVQTQLKGNLKSNSIDKSKTKYSQVHKTEVETLCRLIKLYDATIQKLGKKKPTAAHLDKLQQITDKLVRGQEEERRIQYSWAQNLGAESEMNSKYERKKKLLEERQTLLFTAQNKHSQLLVKLASLSDTAEPIQQSVSKESVSSDNNSLRNSPTLLKTITQGSSCYDRNVSMVQSSPPADENDGSVTQPATQSSSEELDAIHQSLGISDKQFPSTGPNVPALDKEGSGEEIRQRDLSQTVGLSARPELASPNKKSSLENCNDVNRGSAEYSKVFQAHVPVASKQSRDCAGLSQDSQATHNPCVETDTGCVGRGAEVQMEYGSRVVVDFKDLMTNDDCGNENNKQAFNHGLTENKAVNVHSTAKHQSNLTSTDKTKHLKSETTACESDGITCPARNVTNHPVSPCSTVSSSFFPVSSKEIIRRMEIRSASQLYGYGVPLVPAVSHEITGKPSETFSLAPKQNEIVTNSTDAYTFVNEFSCRVAKTEVIPALKDSVRLQNSTPPSDGASVHCTQLMLVNSRETDQSKVQNVSSKAGGVTFQDQVNVTQKASLKDKSIRKRGRPKKQETSCGVDCYSQKKRKKNPQNTISNYFPIIVEHTESKQADHAAQLHQPIITVSTQSQSLPLYKPVGTQSKSLPLYEPVGTQSKSLPLYEPVGTQSKSLPLYESVGTQSKSLPLYESVGTQSKSLPLYESVGTQSKSLPLYESVGTQSKSFLLYEPVGIQSKSLPLYEPVGIQSKSLPLYESIVTVDTQSKPATLCKPAVTANTQSKPATLCKPAVTTSTQSQPATFCKPAVTANLPVSTLTQPDSTRILISGSVDHTATGSLVCGIKSIELIADAEIAHSTLDFPENFWQENFSTITMSQSFWDSLDLW
ncbi:hypothetical protein Btru_002110 [Bulinus truncatus]|nr:hypothetical protein Btru_002110 [Bulinus truncatus]